MSQELARQKRTQAALSLGGAALGLSALGTKGGAVATRQALKRAPAAAGRLRLTPKAAEAMDKTSLGLVTTASGVGGASGIHFAALQRAEAKKEDRVSKNAFGVISKKSTWSSGDRDAHFHHVNAMKPAKLGDPEPDDWKKSPQAPANAQPKPKRPALVPKRRASYKGLKPEDRRQRRMRAEQYGLAGGAAGAAAVTPVLAVAAREQRKKGVANAKYTLRAARRAEHATNAVKLAEEQKGLYEASVKSVTRKTKAGKTITYERGRKAADRGIASWEGKRLRASDAVASQVKQQKAYNQASKKALRLARGSKRASVVAGGTALALGAGAVGVRHMRRHQGKEYTDWWDG